MVFSSATILHSWARQAKKLPTTSNCAFCDKQLVWENRDSDGRGAWHPHHRAKEDKGSDSPLNCVIFCINPKGGCHLKIGHGGDWQKHPTLDNKKLKYLYAGKSKR